jgi:putative endonuclease
MDEKTNYTYILQCSDGSFYTGWTTDLEARVATHNAGKGAKYTRSRLPVELAYYEAFATKQEAMSREWHLKQLTHEEKAALLTQNKIIQNL